MTDAEAERDAFDEWYTKANAGIVGDDESAAHRHGFEEGLALARKERSLEVQMHAGVADVAQNRLDIANRRIAALELEVDNLRKDESVKEESPHPESARFLTRADLARIARKAARRSPSQGLTTVTLSELADAAEQDET